MTPIVPQVVEERFTAWTSKQVYVHLEVNPGAYWRNGRAVLKVGHVKGEGPFRIFLELAEPDGLIQASDITHMQTEPDLLILSGYDDQGRLACNLEVSLKPFSV